MAGSFSGALAGLGEGMQQTGLEMARAAILAERDAKLAEYAKETAATQHGYRMTEAGESARLQQETHRISGDYDTSQVPIRGALESGVLAEREDALRGPKLETKRAESDIAIRQKNLEPRTLSEGQVEVVNGEITGRNPIHPAKIAREESYTRLNNSVADATDSGSRYQRSAGSTRPTLPRVKRSVNEDGTVTLTDELSGAHAIVTPATPGKPGKKGLLWDDKEVPGTPEKQEWRDTAGRPMPGGLEEIYPELAARRAGGAPGGGGAPGQGGQARPPGIPTNAQYSQEHGKWFVQKPDGGYQAVTPTDSPAEKSAEKPAAEGVSAPGQSAGRKPIIEGSTMSPAKRLFHQGKLFDELAKIYPPKAAMARGGVKGTGVIDNPIIKELKALSLSDLIERADQILEKGAE